MSANSSFAWGYRWNGDAPSFKTILDEIAADDPPSQNGGSQAQTVSAPQISGTTPFEETTSVSIQAEQGAEIRYTTDGSTPTAESTLYSAAFTLSNTSTVKAIAIKDGQSSEVASKTFTKSDDDTGEND